MEVLHDYEQFKALYRKTSQRFSKIYSNCPLPNRAVTEALNNSEVYWEEYPQGLVIFSTYQAPEQFLKLFYFLGDINSFPQIVTEKSMIIEELDANGKRDAYIRQITDSLSNAGFIRTAENHMVERQCDNPCISSELNERIASLAEYGFRIVMDPADIDFSVITDLWRKNLKPTDLPSSHLSFPYSESTHLVCVFDPEKNVCGANWWECRGNVCEIRHTVTRSDFRRRHIGSTMILFAVEQARISCCKTVFTYIEDKNTTSLNMYEKNGFHKNGKISIQFIKPAVL